MQAKFRAAIDDLEQLIEHHLGLIDTLPADCYVVEVTGGRSVRVYDDGDIGLGNYRYPQHFALEDCEQLKEVLAGYELKIIPAKDVLRLCVCLPLAQGFKLPQMLMGQIAQNRCYTLAR